MLIKCQWCAVQKNGTLQLSDHERGAHPKQYWLREAEQAEKSVTKLRDWAKKCREVAATYEER